MFQTMEHLSGSEYCEAVGHPCIDIEVMQTQLQSILLQLSWHSSISRYGYSTTSWYPEPQRRSVSNVLPCHDMTCY